MLSTYHQKHLGRTDKETQRRADVKRLELQRIIKAVDFKPAYSPVKIAVLGCADRRFVVHHKKIFIDVLGAPVEMTTFEITTEHLEGAENVVHHDCTKPLPDTPYDIIFGHVFLKFIPKEKQLDVVLNSYSALRPGGIAIHVFDEDEVTATGERLVDGYFPVPLAQLEQELSQRGIRYQELHWDITPQEMPIFIRGSKGELLFLCGDVCYISERIATLAQLVEQRFCKP